MNKMEKHSHEDGQRVFVTADLHLGHEHIIDYCDRPFENVGYMNTALINNWNNTVAKEDKVFFLGDFGFGKREDIIRWGNKLNGHKIMIYGNHDRFPLKVYYDAGFEIVSKWPIVIRDRFLLSHAPIEYDAGELINIHGHIHNDETIGPTLSDKSVCVCVERWNYKPVEIKEIENWLSFLSEC